MQLQIKYFGLLAEITDCSEQIIEFTGSTIAQLIEQLYELYPELLHKEFKVAENLELVSNDKIISSSEIALLPPFAGG